MAVTGPLEGEQFRTTDLRVKNWSIYPVNTIIIVLLQQV